MTARTNETYCIKENYCSNLSPLQLHVYWNSDRIEKAASYQYYVYERCKQLLQRNNLKSVLDVGSGPGTKIKQLIWPVCQDAVLVDHPIVASVAKTSFPEAQFVGVDLEVASVDLGRCFQLIICADVIEHLVDPDPCVTFIRRHLAPDGFAAISTPERDIMRGPECDQSLEPDHVREWNRYELSRYFRARGFDILEHLFYPQKRVSRARYVTSRMLPRRLLPAPLYRYYFGNQVLVCKIARS